MNAVVVHDNHPSLLAKMADRFGVEPNKMLGTLKATAFKGDVSNEQMMALLIVANQYGLNPWTKEIYAFPDRQNGIVPVIGVDGWARIINEHPQFDGMSFQQDDTSCTCTIFRKDRSHAIEVTEYMSECRREIGPWKSHPRRMLRHKAMIQCARLAFGLVGVYDPDEADRLVEAQAEAIPAITIADERKKRCDDAAEQYCDSLTVIREAIAAWDESQDPNELYTVAETWAGIPQAAQMDLWLAPTKGGWFTTHERDVIKTKLPKDEAQ